MPAWVLPLLMPPSLPGSELDNHAGYRRILGTVPDMMRVSILAWLSGDCEMDVRVGG
jgi:hypothetical protein